MKIVADEHIPFVTDYFAKEGELILKPGRAISAAEVREADMLIVRSVTQVNQALLSGSSVKFVGSVTAGADHLDTTWLDEANILWSVANGFNAPPVANYVMSVIAALQKQQILAEKNLKAAVIGVGHVGKLVAEQLKLLQMEVILSDPLRAEQEGDFSSTPLEDLVDMDVISLHVPLTKMGAHPTYHFINQAFLQRQKPGCVLLNASRGAVIDTHDLLAYGKALHWCFDVWEHEPNIDQTILERCVLATPHIAGYSVQSKMRGIDMIYRIACEKKILSKQVMTSLVPPRQELAYADLPLRWQDIVLGVFNPLVITEMLRTALFSAARAAACFDAMRQEFNYRHEFAFTTIKHAHLLEHDKWLLQQLGFRL